jgi:hypothetical protein
LQSVRVSRRAARKAELLAELERSIATVKQQINYLKQPYASKARAFNKMMAKLRQGYIEQTKKIAAVQKELKSL